MTIPSAKSNQGSSCLEGDTSSFYWVFKFLYWTTFRDKQANKQRKKEEMGEESKSPYTTFVMRINFPNGFNVLLVVQNFSCKYTINGASSKLFIN